MPKPTGYEDEDNLRMADSANGYAVVATSGYATSQIGGFVDNNGPAHNDIRGDEDDDSLWVAHEMVMEVGPRWGAIDKVSPTVVVAGYSFRNSDEADDSGMHIERCDWEGYQPENENYLRVRLRVFMRVRGGDGFGVTKLAYHLITRGRILPGDQDL